MGVPEGRSRRVVVGIDLTPESEELLRWADRQAAAENAVLRAVTAFPGVGPIAAEGSEPEPESVTRRVLEQTVASALSPERARLVEIRVSTRHPAETILDQARRADLVVVGPRGRGGITDLLLGSVTERVVSHASCPVVVVHPVAHAPGGQIVVGMDGSDCSRVALDWALRQAELTDAKIRVVAAFDPQQPYGLPPIGASPESRQSWMEELLPVELEKLSPEQSARVSHLVSPGNAAAVLLAACKGADLIVVGNHGAGTAVSRLLGSVSQKVVRHANIPVVVVHDHDLPSAS